MARGVDLILAGPAHARQIEALLASAWQDAGETLAYGQRLVVRHLLVDAARGRVYLVGKAADTIGCVCILFVPSVRHGGRAAIVDLLYLAPGWRKGETAGQVLEKLEQDLSEFGIPAMFAHLKAGDPLADDFRRRGFEETAGMAFSKVLIADDEPPAESEIWRRLGLGRLFAF